MEYTDNQKIIIDVLKSQACFSDSNAMDPKNLISECSKKGLADINELEKALVSLIDSDIIEYDMDDNADVSSIWLLEEQTTE